MLHVILYEPEIPPNTGNIIRLCANVGAQLHLIKPMGFEFDDKRMRRAGLDYHEFAQVAIYDDFKHFMSQNHHRRIFACTTKATQYYHQVQFQHDDMLMFGPESRGLPAEVRALFADTQLKIPMQPNSRSLNLSNATAIILYGALQSLNFEGLM